MKPRRLVSRLEPWPDAPVHVGAKVGSPALVSEILAEYHASPVEVFVALALDARHRILALWTVSQGSATATLVHPREVFGPALRVGAVAVIVAHCHPSGDCTPSAEDVEVTRRLLAAGELLGVPVLDHVVIGAGAFTSIRERVPELQFGGRARG